MVTLTPPKSIAFIDLQAQRERIAEDIDEAVKEVIRHGAYVMGPEVLALEAELERRFQAKSAVSCASGTDALVMVLMALGIGPGDAVFVPSFTFVATPEAVRLVGATPVFVDVNEGCFTMASDSLQRTLEMVKSDGELRPRAVVPVDLFGQPADYPALTLICLENNLELIGDAAQAMGARLDDVPVGDLSTITTTSFYPAKPLGAYGDGGAIFCRETGFAEILRSIRIHGQERVSYEHARLGITGRLDTIQAAVLLQKLKIFEDEMDMRQAVANGYNQRLSDMTTTPQVRQGILSAWASYTIRVSEGQRDKVRSVLVESGVPCAVYYAKPNHFQQPYLDCPCDPAGLAVTESICGQVISLPMHPYLSEVEQDYIADVLKIALVDR